MGTRGRRYRFEVSDLSAATDERSLEASLAAIPGVYEADVDGDAGAIDVAIDDDVALEDARWVLDDEGVTRERSRRL